MYFCRLELRSLIPRINISWPNLFGDKEPLCRPEKKAHGTCSENKYEVLDNFKKTLDIKDKIDILGAFKEVGITIASCDNIKWSWP